MPLQFKAQSARRPPTVTKIATATANATAT